MRNKYDELIQTTVTNGNSAKDAATWIKQEKRHKSQIKEVIGTFFDR
jgi:hypothetical protein